MKNTEKYNVKTRARKSNEDRTLFEQVNITDNFTLTSNTAITIFHVLDTIRMAQAVLNTHMRIDQVSKSCMLFLSMMMRMNSMVMTSARMIPAMGRITLLERF